MVLNAMRRNNSPHKMTHLLIFLWLPLWISLPFIHIHPGIGHAHVSPDHNHTPVFHSIFHTDLPDIQGTHLHHPHHDAAIVLHPTHPEWEHTHQELVHPELQFSTIQPSSDGTLLHWNQLLTLDSDLSLTSLFPASAMVFWHTVIPPPKLPTSSQSPRGPPLS